MTVCLALSPPLPPRLAQTLCPPSGMHCGARWPSTSLHSRHFLDVTSEGPK
jgi:hypothetical protein